MNALIRLERWLHARQPGYRDELRSFQDANERIIRAADKEISAMQLKVLIN